MIKSSLLFERLPPNNLAVEVYSVSAASDAANNASARYFAAPRHDNLKQAVDHLLNYVTGGNYREKIGISGHGTNGYVEVGGGASGSWDLEKFIARYNQSTWALQIDRLFNQNFGSFVIYSCSTGAGVSGAYLLWLMARHMEKPVSARTGLLYIVTQGRRVWLETEAGATWQTATGDILSPPDAIESPSLHLKFMNPTKGFECFENGKLITVKFSEIEHIGFFDQDAKTNYVIEKSNFGTFLENLFFTEAIELAGELLGLIQAEITLKFANNSITLHLYEYRFCKIKDQPAGFYVNENFKEMMKNMLFL